MHDNSIVLQIGLTQYEPAWELLLKQIGIAFKILSENDSLQDEYSLLIVNSIVEPSLMNNINDFVLHGGSVLYTTSSTKELQERTSSVSFVRSLPPAKKNSHQFVNILDLYSNVIFFQNNDFVEIVKCGDGWKAFLGIDVRIVCSSGTIRKNFFKSSGRMPNEVVHKRSRGTIRQLIFSLLKKLHHLRNVPFVHQWYYPGSEPTIFTMRIDSDKGSQQQVDEIFTISETNQIPTTWFLDVKSHESWLVYFRKFIRQEIGIHCYEHILYRSAILNKENFEKALFLLRAINLDPKGITAPTGEWNNGYAAAIESLGFLYSSEFAYDYDNLPSFPFVNGKFSSLPQLPVHPVCIGTMLRARMSDDEMSSFFRSVIDTKYLHNEPIALYHHPTHEHNEVFEEVFRYINERNIHKLTYMQFADWWKQRSSGTCRFKFANERIQLCAGIPTSLYRIIRTDDSESIVAIDQSIELKNIPFTQIQRDAVHHNHLMRSRAFDARHLLQNALDWWIKTTE